MELDDPAYPGQKHYTPAFLKIYDPLVLGLFCRWIWRCPASRTLENYRRQLRQRHLDVGPGTGWFLQHSQPSPDVAITLMDPNISVLTYASRRLAHLRVATVESDVLNPPPDTGPFDSIALNYVLHCLPGPMARKGAAIENLATLLEPHGVLFGATVLGTPRLHTAVSLRALRSNNRQGIFDNLFDTEEGIRQILGASFDNINVDIVGAVAIFAAQRPHAALRQSRYPVASA
jgi:SAM-dependent methyltransferase